MKAVILSEAQAKQIAAAFDLSEHYSGRNKEVRAAKSLLAPVEIPEDIQELAMDIENSLNFSMTVSILTAFASKIRQECTVIHVGVDEAQTFDDAKRIAKERRGHLPTRIDYERQALIDRDAAIRKECADRAVAWVNQCLVDEHMPIMYKRLEEDELRAAIEGKE